MLEGQEKRKDMQTRKSRSKEKVVDFSSASLFPARKQEAVVELVSSKDARTSETVGTFHIQSRKARITRVQAPSPPNN